jgi:hypothetical protein
MNNHDIQEEQSDVKYTRVGALLVALSAVVTYGLFVALYSLIIYLLWRS